MWHRAPIRQRRTRTSHWNGRSQLQATLQLTPFLFIVTWSETTESQVCSVYMEESRSQSLRMKSLQDESSVTKTSSKKDESDFTCPDCTLMTRACTCVKWAPVMVWTTMNVVSMSQVSRFSRTSTGSNQQLYGRKKKNQRRKILWTTSICSIWEICYNFICCECSVFFFKKCFCSHERQICFCFFCLFTAARNQPEPERPKTGRWKEIALYCSLAVTASVCLVGCYCLYVHRRPRRLVSFMYSLCGGSQPSSQSGVGLEMVTVQQMIRSNSVTKNLN